MRSGVGGAEACLVWLGTHGGFSGRGTCTAWLGPWPRWLWRCVWGVSGGGLSRCLAEQPPLRPDLVLVRWRPPRQLLLLSPGLRCGRLHFLPLASAGRGLRQGLPSGEPAKRAPSRPCHSACRGGGASCRGGQRGRAVLGCATCRRFLTGGNLRLGTLPQPDPVSLPEGRVCLATEIARKRTHEFLSLRLPSSACLEVRIVYAEFQMCCSYSILKLSPQIKI